MLSTDWVGGKYDQKSTIYPILHPHLLQIGTSYAELRKKFENSRFDHLQVPLPKMGTPHTEIRKVFWTSFSITLKSFTLLKFELLTKNLQFFGTSDLITSKYLQWVRKGMSPADHTIPLIGWFCLKLLLLTRQRVALLNPFLIFSRPIYFAVQRFTRLGVMHHGLLKR